MVYSVDGEQHLSFNVHEHHWEPADYEARRSARRAG
jgi:hypothetical protein